MYVAEQGVLGYIPSVLHRRQLQDRCDTVRGMEHSRCGQKFWNRISADTLLRGRSALLDHAFDVMPARLKEVTKKSRAFVRFVARTACCRTLH